MNISQLWEIMVIYNRQDTERKTEKSILENKFENKDIRKCYK